MKAFAAIIIILLSWFRITHQQESNFTVSEEKWRPDIFTQGNNDLDWLWNDQAMFLGNKFNVSIPFVKKSLNPYMVVGCFSIESETIMRQNVRDSWARSNVGRDILVWFVLGAPKSNEILNESQNYNDILFLNIPEIYAPGISTLPVKVYGFTQIAEKHFPNTEYFMKTDNDVYVLFDTILDYIDNSYNPFGNNILYGPIHKTRQLIRNPKNKNLISTEQFRGPDMEAHPGGIGYIFTNSLAKCVNEVISTFKPIYLPNEDVFAGIVTRYCPPVQYVDIDSQILESKNIRNEINIVFVHSVKGEGQLNILFNLNCPNMKNCTKIEHTLAFYQLIANSSETIEQSHYDSNYYLDEYVPDNSNSLNYLTERNNNNNSNSDDNNNFLEIIYQDTKELYTAHYYESDFNQFQFLFLLQILIVLFVFFLYKVLKNKKLRTI